MRKQVKIFKILILLFQFTLKILNKIVPAEQRIAYANKMCNIRITVFWLKHRQEVFQGCSVGQMVGGTSIEGLIQSKLKRKLLHKT